MKSGSQDIIDQLELSLEHSKGQNYTSTQTQNEPTQPTLSHNSSSAGETIRASQFDLDNYPSNDNFGIKPKLNKEIKPQELFRAKPTKNDYKDHVMLKKT